VTAALAWASTQFSEAEQFAAWEAALSQSHLPWSLDRAGRAGFRAQLTQKDFGSVKVVGCATEPCAGRRGHSLVSRTPSAYFGALLVIAGTERVCQDGRQLLLRERSLMVWDSTTEIDFAIDSAVEKVTLFIPQDRFAGAPSVRDHVGEVIDCRTGVPAVLAAQMQALAGQLDAIDVASGASAVNLTVDLLVATLEARDRRGLTAQQAALLETIHAFIFDNLADPNLTPDVIAERFSISKRYLHLLYARTGHTVCQFIQGQRLDRAQRLLGLPSAHRTVTEVAASAGLVDPAHFSRVFKARFGVSPREYRRSVDRCE
jgi:AraC-like DNA-binding protein